MVPKMVPGLALSSLFVVCYLLASCIAQETSLEPQLLGSSAVVRKAVSVMYVFGGMSTNSSTPVNDLYEFDMTQRLWTVTEFASEDRPPSRMFHAATISADSRVRNPPSTA